MGSDLESLIELPEIGKAPEYPVPDRQVRWSVETPIDPEVYRVVPGDIVSLGIWGENSIAYSLVVSPEGELVVPKAGTFPLAGRTLREAEAVVAKALRDLFPGSEITLRLREPGRFRVSVTGMVARPGVYEATGADRLTTVIDAAGGIRPGGSVRRIQIRSPVSIRPTETSLASAGSTQPATRLEADPGSGANASPDPAPGFDGKRVEPAGREIDLLPWLIDGDLSANPVLEPGTLVQVPPVEQKVRLRGPVNGRSEHRLIVPGEPGEGNRPEEDPELVAEWRDGDTIGSLLLQAGGLSAWATTNGRLIRKGSAAKDLDLESPEDLATLLVPDDLVEIEYAPRWVSVVGAVHSPGRYPYYPGYTAREYVSLAGGETELGRSSGWKVSSLDGDPRDAKDSTILLPGMTLRVPERRSTQLTRLLAPMTSAAALVISVVAILNRR